MILERKLDVVTGHVQSQINAIDDLSGRNDIVILSSLRGEVTNRMRIMDDPRIVRAFRPILEGNKAPKTTLAKDIPIFCDFLAKRDDIHAVLVPTATVYEIRLILAAIDKGLVPDVVVLRLLEVLQFERLTETEQSQLRAHVDAGQIRLVTETASLCDLLADRHRLASTPRMVLPCMVMPNDAPVARTAKQNSDGKAVLNVGFLGVARREKGWHSLYLIVRELAKLLREQPLDAEIQFFIPRRHNSRFRISNLWRDLRIALAPRAGGFWGRPQITIRRTPHYLPEEEFVSALQALDVVLVPYRPQNYANRGSGIILDSVLSERPLIYSKGIGMAEYLTHGNAVAATTPAEFAQGIHDLLSDPTQTEAGCRAARDFARKQFANAGEMIKSL